MRLLWVDMEMTGLEPTTERIIEVAAIITDMSLEPIADYHSVVFQSQDFLDRMDDWNQKTHRASGLVDLIPSGKSQNQVDNELSDWVSAHFPNERAVLAGNSIHQDRKFIDLYMPKLSAFLHYRMVDVSAFKIMFKEKFGVQFEKGTNHRALDDIHASIAELKHYLSFVQVQSHGPNGT